MLIDYAYRLYDYTERQQILNLKRWKVEILRTALALDTATQKYNTAIKAAERQQQDTSWFDALFWTAFQLVIPLGVAWLGAGAKNLMVNSIARSQNKVLGLLAQYSVNSGKLVRISPKQSISLHQLNEKYFFGDLDSVFVDVVKDYAKMAEKAIPSKKKGSGAGSASGITRLALQDSM